MEGVEEIASVSNRPNLILMVGLPGSGKTTAARKLQNIWASKAYIILSPDDILMEMGKADGLTYTQSVRKFSFKKAENIFLAQLKQSLADRKNIIVDRTNLTILTRSILLQNVPGDYTRTALICEIAPELLKVRLEERAQKTGKKIPAKVLAEMIEGYRLPTRHEFDEIKRVK